MLGVVFSLVIALGIPIGAIIALKDGTTPKWEKKVDNSILWLTFLSGPFFLFAWLSSGVSFFESEVIDIVIFIAISMCLGLVISSIANLIIKRLKQKNNMKKERAERERDLKNAPEWLRELNVRLDDSFGSASTSRNTKIQTHQPKRTVTKPTAKATPIPNRTTGNATNTKVNATAPHTISPTPATKTPATPPKATVTAPKPTQASATYNSGDPYVAAQQILLSVLAPFVEKTLKQHFGANWWKKGVLDIMDDRQRMHVTDKGSYVDMDIALCRRLVMRHWKGVFQDTPLLEHRHYIDELKSARNQKAHVTLKGVSDADISRGLDTMARICELFDKGKADRIRALIR